MMAPNLSAKIRFCVSDKQIQYFAHLAQVVNEFDDSFLCICDHICFAGIVVETNCTLSMVEEMFCLPSRKRSLSVNLQCSFCNRVVISTHSVDELYSCKGSLRHSSFLVEYDCGLRIARVSPNLQI